MKLRLLHKIPPKIRAQVNTEFERWILDHIHSLLSFAIKTTLRSPVTFQQARLALQHGFRTEMEYVICGSVQESVRRIMERSYRGGHSASERLVGDIYARSTKNLLMAIDFEKSGIEVVRVYDNSKVGGRVRQVLAFRRGQVRRIAPEIPGWLEELFRGTNFEIEALRKSLSSTQA